MHIILPAKLSSLLPSLLDAMASRNIEHTMADVTVLWVSDSTEASRVTEALATINCKISYTEPTGTVASRVVELGATMKPAGKLGVNTGSDPT